MWYLIEGFDGDDALPRRAEHRPAHLARLAAIDAEDPGPAGFSGSAVIAEFASLDEARIWAEADPYISGGVYVRVEVRPFRKVLP